MCKAGDFERCDYRTEWKMGYKVLSNVEKLKNSVLRMNSWLLIMRAIVTALVWASAVQLIGIWLIRGPRVFKVWPPCNQLDLHVASELPRLPIPVFPPKRVYKNNGYLMVSCNGGLNQMRAAICDMVAIARYMNVTLIVPELDKNSFWVASEFQDIFDVNHFIRSLRDEVWILKQLPPKLNNRPAYSLPPVSWFNISYYLHQVEETSRKLVRILREKCPFLVLHLRYEMDMLSFSGCSHGCISDLVEELNTIRETCHTVYAGKHVLIPEFPFKALAELRRDQRVPWHPPLLC